MKTIKLFTLLILFLSLTINAQIIDIPDANFKAALVNNASINTDGDDEISSIEARWYSGIINVAGMSITDLTGIEHFKEITRLDCNNNSLTKLDISFNNKLQELYCDDNNLELLKVTSNNAAYNKNLTNLTCANNKLVSLNIFKKTNLQILNCANNQLKVLNASQNTSLQELICNNNNIEILNIANGNNTSLTGLISFVNNPDLSCIQVDDASYADANWSIYKDSSANYSKSCYVNIPDSDFKSILLSYIAVNTNKDTEISYSEALDFESSLLLSLSGLSVTDVSGVEAFENILALRISEASSLKAIDISNLTKIKSLDLDYNAITNLDLFYNTELTTISCNSNSLSSLNLVNLPLLRTLTCNSNQISFLDISANKNLEILDCSNNDLVALNLNNENNTDFDITSFTRFNDNPNLSCIQVDDVAYANANWAALKDVTASYGEACYVNIPDTNFKTALVDDSTINTDSDTEISFKEAANYFGEINVSGLSIADATGIEAFPNITLLKISNNLLTNLDASYNSKLKNVICGNNQITHLNVDNLNALEGLNCASNLLTNIEVSNVQKLRFIDCKSNNLVSLDVSKNPFMVNVICSSNKLTMLNLANGNNLNFNNSSSANNFKSNPNLTCIQVDDAAYSTANWASLKDTTASYSEDCSLVTLITSMTNGTITITPEATDGIYEEGTIVELTATSDSGYLFDGWSGDATGITNPLSITMDSDKSITALFSLKQHTLTTTAISKGGIVLDILPIDGTYDYGTEVLLTAYPNRGYQFDGWSGDATGIENPLTLIMDSDKDITATFSEISIITYTLNINVSNGAVRSNSPSEDGIYEDGTELELTATPNLGYQFDGWSGDVIGIANPISVTMDADKEITANFSLLQHILTTEADDGSISVNISPTNGTYDYGKVVTLTAIPSLGYQFDRWSGDITGITNPIPVTMDADKNITALFSLQATASIINSTFDKTIIVFPNPVKDVLEIKSTKNQLIERVEVFTLLGKKVMQQKNSMIDFTLLPKGIYIVEIQNDKGYIAIRKVIK